MSNPASCIEWWPGPPSKWPEAGKSLLASDPVNGVYSHPLWLEHMSETVDFGRGARVGAGVLRQGDALRSVLPLVALPHQLRSWANFYVARAAPVVSGPPLDAAEWRSLLSGLRQQAHPASTIELGPWPSSMINAPAMREGARAAGLTLQPHFRFGNWLWTVDQSWGEYWRTRNGALRNTVERKRRRFERAGGRLILHTGSADLEPVIAAYQHIYARSWKPAEEHPGFMPGLLRLAAQQGWLRLGMAWLGNEPVAAQLWLVYGGRADIYKLAHQEAHAQWGCGSVLTALLMEHALEADHVHTVDYGMGDETYKRAWTPQRQEMWAVKAAPEWSAAGVELRLRQAWHRLRGPGKLISATTRQQ